MQYITWHGMTCHAMTWHDMTWHKITVFDHEILAERYYIFRRDRASSSISQYKKDDGGMLFGLTKKYDGLRNTYFKLNNKFRIKIKQFVLHICAVYIPPPVS